MDRVQANRLEKDLLGIKEVPNHCYYGIHTMRALENFKISSLNIGQQPYFYVPWHK
jgi:aspartate ammonia-lyase